MWKDIKEFIGYYQINDNGEVRSLDRNIHFKYKDRFYKGDVIRQQTGKHGYKIVKLHKGKKQYTFTVHKLVAEHFLEKPSYAECVNHKNGNKLDNRVENLEWVTYRDNNIHALKNGLRKPKTKGIMPHNIIKVVMFDEENIIAIKESSKEMAQFVIENFEIKGLVDTVARSIRSVCKQNEIGFSNVQSTRRRKTAYGYKFSYLKDYSKPVSTNCKTTIDT